MSPDVGTSRASRSRLLFGVGFRPRSASQAIDLPSDGGAILNACLHAEARKSVAESGDRALDLGHRSVILWDAKPSIRTPAPKAPPLRSSSRSSSAVVRHGICRRVQQPSSGSTPHDRVTDLLVVLTASRLATAEHVQISASHRNSSDNLCGATPGAAHLSAACPQATYWLGLNPIPCPRHSNPHDARGTPCVSPARFSFLKAFGRRPSEPSGTLTRWAGIRKPSHKRKSGSR
jgi:hypothetical protein